MRAAAERTRDDGRHHRFRRVPAGSVRFLDQLRDNNDPAWFKPRKALYETEVLAPLRDLIAAVGGALGQAGLPSSAIPTRHLPDLSRRPLLPRQAALQDACRRGADAFGRPA